MNASWKKEGEGSSGNSEEESGDFPMENKVCLMFIQLI